LQWLGDVKAKSFIFAITFGHGGQIHFQKPATANSQTLAAIAFLGERFTPKVWGRMNADKRNLGQLINSASGRTYHFE